MERLMEKRRIAVRLLGAMKKRIRFETRLASRQGSPFRVLIATILSQRTRDENSNRAASALFAKYGSPKALAGAPLEKIESLVKPAGFYRQKSKRIKRVCKILVEKFKGKVPRKIGELLELPGVGRKTANCVLVYGFGISAIPSDTHVHRLSNLFGLVRTKTPEQTEFKLMEIFPKKYWLELNETFVRFGQQVCRPGMPRKNCLEAVRKKIPRKLKKAGKPPRREGWPFRRLKSPCPP